MSVACLVVFLTAVALILPAMTVSIDRLGQAGEEPGFTESKTDEPLSVLTYRGKDYTVQLTYGADAGIPETAALSAEEIKEGSSSYSYVTGTENALGMKAGNAGNIRLFDIEIVDRKDPDVKYQPADGTWLI